MTTPFGSKWADGSVTILPGPARTRGRTVRGAVWVDFNGVDSSGHLATLARFAPGLTVGRRVTVCDGDGLAREADVVSFDEAGVVTLRLLDGP